MRYSYYYTDRGAHHVPKSGHHWRFSKLQCFTVGVLLGAFTVFMLSSGSADTNPGAQPIHSSSDTQHDPDVSVTALQESSEYDETHAIEEEENIVPEATPKPIEPTITYPLAKRHTIKRGDVLGDVLTKDGIDHQQVASLIKSMKPIYNPRKLKAGQTIEYTLDKVNDSVVLSEMEIDLDKVRYVTVNREIDGVFKAEKKTLPQIYKTSLGKGIIRGSFYESAVQKDVPDGVIMELIKKYSYGVDFQRDIKAGDHFEVMFEKKQTENGITTGYGAIHYANLKLAGKSQEIYRYKNKAGHVAYYHPNGESIVKSLLATPMNGARISSNFGMRKHPVLGYNKMHKGTDFAAPTGTPIYAAGNGVVEFRGRNGGYGNYVRIRHNGKYKTAYAHMSRFGKGIRKGSHVKQGQIIGYVGSTGRSTGPHLHYEVLEHGNQVNPRKKKFNASTKLAGADLKAFQKVVDTTKAQIAKLDIKQGQTLASAE